MYVCISMAYNFFADVNLNFKLVNIKQLLFVSFRYIRAFLKNYTYVQNYIKRTI